MFHHIMDKFYCIIIIFFSMLFTESAAYAMARSRTLQRRRHILHTVGTAPLRQHLQHRDRPGTSESVHQTSIASDLSADDAERLDELNAELQQL